MRHATLAAAVALTGSIASAQEVVGTAVVEGRTVELFDDGTWAARDADENCEALTPHLSFCGDTAVWVPQPPPGPAINAQYARTSVIFAQYVSEPLGLEIGVDMATMEDAVRNNAAAAMGVDPSTVIFEIDRKTRVDGFDARTVGFAYQLGGFDFYMLNTFGVGETFSFQIMSFEGNTQVKSQALEDVLAEFTELTVLTGP